MPDKDIDEILKNALKAMGVDRTIPPQWVSHKHRAIDRTTQKTVKEYNDGFICSFCGKHSYSKKDKCNGCGSVMKKGW